MTKQPWLPILLGAALAGLSEGSSPAAEAALEAAAPAEVRAAQPEPAVSKQGNVNVRAQAAINSEVVTQLKKGQLVSVLEEVTLKKAKADEPAQWFRIALPADAVVWVHGDYVDKDSKAVRPRRLNLRAGAGENYSVVGRVERGTVLTVLGEKGLWLKVAAPANSFGFVAAHLLSKDPAAVAAAQGAAAPVVAVQTPPTNVVVAPAPAVETRTNEPVPVVTTELTNVTPVVATNVVVVPAETNVVSTPPSNPALTNLDVTPARSAELAAQTNAMPAPPIELVKRVITREGLLKGSFSIQAPSYFELRSLDNNKLINYIWSPTTNIVLKEFKGKKVLVTGEELLDERWPNTPVITVDEITSAP